MLFILATGARLSTSDGTCRGDINQRRLGASEGVEASPTASRRA